MDPSRDTGNFKERFDRDGYVWPVPILEPHEVLRYRAAYDRLEADAAARGQKARPTNLHHQSPEVWELATHPRVLGAIESIVGPDVVLISSGFFAKQPRSDDQFVAWHQDTTYWGLEPPFALTVWIAIDDSDIANGCMRVIPATHRRGLLPHAKSDRPGNLLAHNQAIEPGHVDESKAVDFVLKAGWASIHHGELVHGSNPNRSTRRRCGMTVRFTTPNVRPVKSGPFAFSDRPVLIRGADRLGHFDYAPMPAFVSQGS